MIENQGFIPSFEEALGEVKNQLQRHLTTAPLLIRSQISHLAKAQGKLIRASALLACAQGVNGEVPSAGIPMAVALELLHLATLVHDDVVDQAETRRGVETLHRLYGRHTAVICGDYLLCTALKIASQIEEKEKYLHKTLPDYLSRVCLGELRQQENNGNLDLTPMGYFRIIRGKTAALFEGAFHAGAVLATENPRALRLYAKTGTCIGMIFQLADDCMDYVGNTATAKKNVRWDYEQGVVTLPLIRALELDPELKSRSVPLSGEEIRKTVLDLGGVSYTAAVASRYYSKAVRLLDALELPIPKRVRLQSLLEQAGNFLSERKF